jgi:hypothetical protein
MNIHPSHLTSDPSKRQYSLGARDLFGSAFKLIASTAV